MATWTELVGYVRSNYKIAEEKPGMVKMIFETEGLRSQVVFLWQQTLSGGTEEWLQIESPFAQVGAVNLVQVLEEVGQTVCGGASLTGGHITFRHSVPLENLNINEFERPLRLVTTTADYLEQKFVGGDKY